MQRHSYVRRCGGLEPHSEMRRRHGERSRGGRALKRRVGRVWGLQLTPPPAHSGSPRLHRNPERPAGLTPRAGTWNPPCETHGTGAQNLQAAAAHGKGARGTGAGGGGAETLERRIPGTVLVKKALRSGRVLTAAGYGYRAAARSTCAAGPNSVQVGSAPRMRHWMGFSVLPRPTGRAGLR